MKKENKEQPKPAKPGEKKKEPFANRRIPGFSVKTSNRIMKKATIGTF